MKRPAALLAVLAILAAGARLAAILHTDALHARPEENRQIALHLLHGDGFSFVEFAHLGPTSLKPPVYPMLMSGVYSLFGEGGDRAGVVLLALNVLCSAAAVVVAYALARRFTSTTQSLLFAALIALWPTQIFAATYFQPLAIALLLLLVTLWLMTSQKLALAPLAGLLAGLTALTESLLAMPLAAVVLLVAVRRPAHALLLTLGAITLITPWMLRNSIVHHQLTGITSTTWRNLYLGNGPGATGSTHLALRDAGGRGMHGFERLTLPEISELKGKPEAARNGRFKQWAMAWIKSHPLEYAKLCLVRVVKAVWLDWHHPLAWHPANVLARTAALIGFVAAFASCAVGHRKTLGCRPTCTLAAAIVIAIVLGTMWTLVEARQSVYMDVAQLLAAATLLRGRSEVTA